MKRIKKVVYEILNKICPSLLHCKISYSQDGEDLLLASFYEEYKRFKGFFIDAGAHHPFRFSNTAYFYKQGWRGINIEPTPDLFKSFVKHRKRDININTGIGTGEMLSFYVFNEGALNTFDPLLAEERNGSHNGKYRIVNQLQIKTQSLGEILDKHLPADTHIDLLTIDVEGMDYIVLQSNNWEKYIPDFILIECEEHIDNLNNDKIYQFLCDKNYSLVGRTKRTSLFRHNNR